MCSELARIPYEWNGVPIFGFGILLALWAVACVALFVASAARKDYRGEIIGYFPVLIIVGAAIFFLPKLFPGGLPIRGYGVMVVLGAAAGVGLAVRRAIQVGLDYELILSLTIWLVVFGIVGARLFYVIEYWQADFARPTWQETLVRVLDVPEGGLVVFGGLIGAAAGFVIFALRNRLPLLPLADLIAPSLAIGLALGRIGCFLNGCCYGGESDRPWAVTFPKLSSRFEAEKPLDQERFSPPYADQAAHGEMYGFRIESQGGTPAVVTRVDAGSAAASAGLQSGDIVVSVNGAQFKSLPEATALIFNTVKSEQSLVLGRQSGGSVTIPPVELPARSRPVHPAQLYSAIDAAILCWLLWSFYPFRAREGQSLALLLTIHPVARFLQEIIRTDEPAVFGTGLSISQNISLALFVIAGGLWWYLLRRPPGVFDWSKYGPAAASPARR